MPFPDVPVWWLLLFIPEWKKLTSDPFILNMVSGMRPDLVELPHQSRLPHEIRMSDKETEAAKTQIQTSLDKKQFFVVISIWLQTSLSNIFLTPKLDGSFKMILNLKKFNSFLQYIHFKIESLQQILDLVMLGCFMVILCILRSSDWDWCSPSGSSVMAVLSCI